MHCTSTFRSTPTWIACPERDHCEPHSSLSREHAFLTVGNGMSRSLDCFIQSIAAPGCLLPAAPTEEVRGEKLHAQVRAAVEVEDCAGGELG